MTESGIKNVDNELVFSEYYQQVTCIYNYLGAIKNWVDFKKKKKLKKCIFCKDLHKLQFLKEEVR